MSRRRRRIGLIKKNNFTLGLELLSFSLKLVFKKYISPGINIQPERLSKRPGSPSIAYRSIQISERERGVRGCLHVRFSIRIPIRFGVRFAAKGVQQVIFCFFWLKMWKWTILMGDRKIIGSLFCLRRNRARNRTAIRMAIRTRVDSPLVCPVAKRLKTFLCHPGGSFTKYKHLFKECFDTCVKKLCM
jgi:hypothetical protein